MPFLDLTENNKPKSEQTHKTKLLQYLRIVPAGVESRDTHRVSQLNTNSSRKAGEDFGKCQPFLQGSRSLFCPYGLHYQKHGNAFQSHNGQNAA